MGTKRLALLLALLLGGARAEAATLQVGPSRTYTNIPAALAAANQGDVIELDEDLTFTGCFVLPDKGPLASPIRIRSSAPNANLPGVGVRFDPGNVTSGTVWQAATAMIQACTGGASALTAANGSQDYIIGPGIKFLPNPGGFGAIITLGSNSTGQDLESEQPQDIVFDRNWVTGDPIFGQKIGIDMGGKNITVTNNFVDYILGVGQDAIALRNVNGYGPYYIENNFLASSGENFISGGDSPQTRTHATVNAGATTTAATISALSGGHPIGELHVGQLISFLTGTNTGRVHTYVRSCGTTTPGASCTSTSLTYDATPTPPDTGAGSDAAFGAIANGFTIRRNHFYKRLEWRDPIIGQPVVLPPTPTAGTGALPAATYWYRVQSRNTAGYNNTSINGVASTEVQCTLTATGQCALSWPAIPNATKYRVFRGTASGAQTGYFETTTNSATDTGLALTTGTIPSSSRWAVKNLFEIKFGTNWVIEFNEFENSWTGVDNGQGIWLKSNDYGGVTQFAQTKNLLFQNNRIRNVPGCFNILGRNENGVNAPAPMENVTIRNVACLNSNSSWLDSGDGSQYAININEPVIGLTLENMTIDHQMRGLMYLIATSGPQVTGLVIRNIIAPAESNGIFASGYSCSKGSSCMQAFSPGYVFAGNAIFGASASAYPAGNTFPPAAEFTGSTHFTNYAAGDFTLKGTSPLKGTGTGGTDPGVNWSVLLSGLTGVTSGAAPSTTPLDITTAPAIPPIAQSTACSLTFAKTGGTGTVTWTKTSGSYPAGCTVSSAGVLSGTATTPGTGTFRLRATDSTAGTPMTDEQDFTWSVTPTSSTLAFVTSGTLPATEVAVPFEQQLVCTGGTAPYRWDVTVGSVPGYASLSPTGLYSAVPDLPSSGTPSTPVSFTARCTDAVGATATRAFTQVVSVETMTCSRARFYRPNGLRYEASLFRRPTPPTTSAPDCAMKGDLWFDTKNLRLQVAKTAAPLTWGDPSASDTGGGDLTGVVRVDGTPEPGDIPVGDDAGGWVRKSTSELEIDATAIKSGTLDPARLPPTGWAMVPFHIPATASTTWNSSVPASTALTNAELEIFGTTSKRMQWDTRGMTQVQLHFKVQGANSSANSPRCYAKYSLDDSTFTAIVGGDVSLSVAGTKTGPWAAVPVAAQTETTIWSIFCAGGDGTATFAVGAVALQFK